jgi:hypothetical protein
VPAAVAVLSAIVVIVSPNGSARATDDCIEAPNSQPPQGSHWYYRTDRVNQRKCWYLGPEGKKVQVAPQVQPTAKSVAAPEAETADDRLAPTVQPRQQTMQTHRQTRVVDAIQEGASAVAWPDPPDLTGVFARGAAMSARALQEHSTVAAQDIMPEERVPADPRSASVSIVPDTAMVAPLDVLLRVLALLAGALAIAGMLLQGIFKIAVIRRRPVLIDGSGHDCRSGGDERTPPTFASESPSPRLLDERVESYDALEEMLREMLRARERQAA